MSSSVLKKLQRKYPDLYRYDVPQDYVNAYIAQYLSCDPDDDAPQEDMSLISDKIYADVYPYYYGFVDETDEEYTRRMRRKFSKQLRDEGIDPAFFRDADDLASALLSEYTGGDNGYSDAASRLVNKAAWFYKV